MWTEITRAQYARDGGRYASDLREAEWRLIAPDMPDRKPLGRRRSTDLREVVNAILYVLRTGCPWRMLPKEFPPWQTVYRYFSAWRDSGLWVSIGHRLMLKARKAEGRRASPSAGKSRSGGSRRSPAAPGKADRDRAALTRTGPSRAA